MVSPDPLAVAVIGAGMAGLGCARRLQQAGVMVRVFDKGRHPGGRVASRDTAAGSCDHGAQFFTGRTDAFVNLMRSSGAAAAPWALPTKPEPCWVGAPSMRDFARSLAHGLEVHNGLTLTGLQRRDDGWQLRLRDHNDVTSTASGFAAVLLTVPAPQLASLLPAAATLDGSDVRYAPSWTVMLAPDGPPPPVPAGQRLEDGGPLGWVADEQSKPQRAGHPRYIVQASAAWSAAHIESTADAVMAQIGTAMRQMWAVPFRALSAHRWRYALATHCADGPQWDDHLRLGCAGDGFAAARVESAWGSGVALADIALVHLGRAGAGG